MLLIHPSSNAMRRLAEINRHCIYELIPLLDVELRSAQDDERLEARRGQILFLIGHRE